MVVFRLSCPRSLGWWAIGTLVGDSALSCCRCFVCWEGSLARGGDGLGSGVAPCFALYCLPEVRVCVDLVSRVL